MDDRKTSNFFYFFIPNPLKGGGVSGEVGSEITILILETGQLKFLWVVF